MNQKLKCLIAAVLTLVMLMSAAVALPVTAADNEEAGETAAQATETVTQPATETDSIFRGLLETDDPAEDEYIPEKEVPELASTGIESGVNGKTFVYREGFYSNRITIKWKKINDVDGFRVYWCDLNKENAATKLLTTVTADNRTITLNNQKQGAKYRFTVKPYVKDGENIVEGKGDQVIAATIPAPVRNFRLKSASQARTVILWRRTVGIDGYLLLRQSDGKWEEYKYLSPATTQFTDTNVIPGHAYYYKIMTYRKDTRGYLRSKTALLRTVCGLCAPADTGSTSRANRVHLSWRNIRFATGYQVFYSTDGANYRGLAITDDTELTTKKFTAGTKVWFRIRPYRLVGKSKTQVLGTVSQFAVKVVASPFGEEVGDTYIEIDISDQHMWYIVDGDIYVSTDVVTGNYDSMDTPTGIFSVRNKARNVSLVGAGYVSFVEYWIAFIGSSYGIHDASWRSSFGDSIYKGNGSHGCVNTPYDAVKKIYNHIDVGTPVVVHR